MGLIGGGVSGGRGFRVHLTKQVQPLCERCLTSKLRHDRRRFSKNPYGFPGVLSHELMEAKMLWAHERNKELHEVIQNRHGYLVDVAIAREGKGADSEWYQNFSLASTRK